MHTLCTICFLCDIKTKTKLNPGLMIALMEICKLNKRTVRLVVVVEKYITTAVLRDYMYNGYFQHAQCINIGKFALTSKTDNTLNQ